VAREKYLMSAIKPMLAEEISENSKKSIYPEPFASLMNGRVKSEYNRHPFYYSIKT